MEKNHKERTEDYYKECIANGKTFLAKSQEEMDEEIALYPILEGHVKLVSEQEYEWSWRKKNNRGRNYLSVLSAIGGNLHDSMSTTMDQIRTVRNILNPRGYRLPDIIVDHICPQCGKEYERVKGDKYTHCSKACFMESKKKK